MESIDSTDFTVSELYWRENPTLGLFYPFVSKVLFTYMVLISRCVVYTSPFWNFNFFIWHEIEDVITLVTYLRYSPLTRQGFEKKSYDQVYDFTNQRYLSRGILVWPSTSYPVKYYAKDWWNWLIGKDWFFSIWNLVSKSWLVLRICSLLTKMFLLLVTSN